MEPTVRGVFSTARRASLDPIYSSFAGQPPGGDARAGRASSQAYGKTARVVAVEVFFESGHGRKPAPTAVRIRRVSVAATRLPVSTGAAWPESRMSQVD
jgi:hypothetical protein